MLNRAIDSSYFFTTSLEAAVPGIAPLVVTRFLLTTYGFVRFVWILTRVQAANLVANGSFESGTLGIGSFQGWQTNLGDSSTYVDSNGKTGPLYGQAFNGLWAAYFGSTSASGGSSISQTLATTANQSYVRRSN